jgi:DNA-binding response OmpR family regulator
MIPAPAVRAARVAGGLRAAEAGRNRAGTKVFCFGALEIDLDARRACGQAATSYQFALLAALAAHLGRVLSREAIMDL